MDSSIMFLNPDGGLQSDMLAASPRETLYSENGGGFGRDSRSESFYRVVFLEFHIKEQILI